MVIIMQTENTNDIPVAPQPAPQPVTQAEPQKSDVPASKGKPGRKRNRKRQPVRALLRIIISLAVIAGGIWLILFVVMLFSNYTSISQMLGAMRIELELMWERIIR